MARETEYYAKRWRRFAPKSRFFRGPLPLAPLLNVGMLIILFKMLGGACILRPGVSVELPEFDFTGGTLYGSRVVSVTREGRVFFNDEWMSMGNLEAQFKRDAVALRNSSLVIEADDRVPYGYVMKVISLAAAAQIQQVNLATRPVTETTVFHENVERQE